MTSCDICDEKINKSNRIIIKCYCDFEACKLCVKRYITSKSEEAHCMSCKVHWDSKFMSEKFDKSFLTKEYRQFRTEIIFERETGMLPATQEHVEKQIMIENYNKDKLLIKQDILDLKRKLLVINVEKAKQDEQILLADLHNESVKNQERLVKYFKEKTTKSINLLAQFDRINNVIYKQK